MAAKYFVWGEGVWREVDVASGCVAGWRRRARFVFVRRGRLLLARRRPVLRALQALAGGQAGAAADGPRLSHRSKPPQRSKHRHKSPSASTVPLASTVSPALSTPCVHQQHCCAHKRCVYNDTQSSASPAPAAPPAPPAPAPLVVAPVKLTPTQVAAVEALVKHSISTKRRPQDAGASAALGLTINAPHKPQPPPAAAASAASSADETWSKLTNREVRANTRLDALLYNCTSATKSVAATAQKRRPGGDTAPRERRARVESSDVSSSSGGGSAAVCKELLVSEADVAALRGYVLAHCPAALPRFDADEEYKRQLFYSINPLVDVERCARLERLLRQRATQFAAQLGLTPRTQAGLSPRTQSGPQPRASPPPARRLRPRSDSTDTDKENKEKYSFPNTVRSKVVDVVKKSPRLRASPAASEPSPARSSSRGVSERSNKVKQEVIKATEMNGDVSDSPKPKPKRPTPSAPLSRQKQASSASDPGAAASSPHAALSPLAVRAPAGTHVISQRASRGNAKEYSNLEDHAIVAWVSSGARASLVSGNRVWRDLQEQYERLTGRVRSWHSLRNRYLRYILPALGALHLAPADVSRLRAAAATGAIKTKQRVATRPVGSAGGAGGAGGARRNSMFKSPALGASSRLPRSASSADEFRPTAADMDDDDSGPTPPKRRSLRSRGTESVSQDTADQLDSSDHSRSKAAGSKGSPGKSSKSKDAGSKDVGSKKARSPRYSEVTRRFAARHRPPAPPSTPSPRSSRSPSPVLPPSTRSRRLYNPNAQ